MNFNYDIYTNYINSILHQDVEQWSFKSAPEYCWVLEHVSEEQGYSYLNEIITHFNDMFYTNKEYLIELCKINDIYGKTNKRYFKDFILCSPTNLRYILQSLLILKFITDCNLNKLDIIEIGGGYGGLCFFIHKLAHLFKVTINSYSIFDLKSASSLQEKYLNKLEIPNINCVQLDEFTGLKNNSFLISNYAFSEFTTDLRERYSKEIINPYTSHGFLAWNFIDIYDFVDGKTITKEKEFPLTSDRNFYVRFRPI